MTDNPLLKYMNKPGIYVRLPSGGRFYDERPILTADGDIEVHPLTAIDELYLKNPDGLYNNDSLIKVIKNAVPNIPNPSEILTCDLDSILVAMRVATYGKDMDVSVKCKKCNHLSSYMIDLNNILATAVTVDQDNSIEISDGLVVTVRPYTLTSNIRVSDYSMSIAKLARKFQQSANAEETEKLKRELADAISNSSHDLIRLASECVISITTPEGDTVTDHGLIEQYIEKLDAPTYAKIRDLISDLSNEKINRKFDFNCDECGEKNTGEVSFDPANFFDTNSASVKATKT